VKRQAKKGRAVKQTQFDQKLIAVESLVAEFSDLLHQPSADPKRLWDIRLRELPDAVRSLEWAMKTAQMTALPMEGWK
jgi:hypothetical protein